QSNPPGPAGSADSMVPWNGQRAGTGGGSGPGGSSGRRETTIVGSMGGGGSSIGVRVAGAESSKPRQDTPGEDLFPAGSGQTGTSPSNHSANPDSPPSAQGNPASSSP